MEIIEKLKKLLPHWQNHNREHAETFKKWAEKAEADGYNDLSELLNRLYEEFIKIDSIFEEAIKEINKK